MKDMKINILGTWYFIVFKDNEEICKDYGCGPGEIGGFCSDAEKLIEISNLDQLTAESKGAIEIMKKLNLRHEIIHAFLNESGLSDNSGKADNWAKNEEMVDWFAIQSPKIYKVFEELDIM